MEVRCPSKQLFFDSDSILVDILSPACHKKIFCAVPFFFRLETSKTLSAQVVSFAFSNNIPRLNTKHVLECSAGLGPALLELHNKSMCLLF